MKGICALYGEQTELMESHIFPKFVIKHNKKTGSKYLRRFEDPNKRLQDGPKYHLLGFKAEQEFSKREKWFAENILQSYSKGQKLLRYDENLYYFAISFLWRILLTEFKMDPILQGKWYLEELKKVKTEWRDFLRDGKIPENYHNVNLWFTDNVERNNTGLDGVDFYFTRIMDSTIVDDENQTFVIVYGKFNRFIFWSVIKSPEYNDELYEVEIHPKGGNFEIPQDMDYKPLLSFFPNRIKRIESLPRPNQSQQDKIEEEILKDPEKFWDSDVGRSLYNDITKSE